MYRVFGLALVLCLLTGCQDVLGRNEAGKNAADAVYYMAENIDLSYEVPSSSPSILVNQEGYRVGSKKIAVFQGEKLPQNFYVINSVTQQQVYSGRIEAKGYGNFTDLELPGEYYIEADYIGQSYTFKIGGNLYENTFESACSQFIEKENDAYKKMTPEDTCYVLTNLLTAFELYGEEFDLYAPELLEKLKDYTDSLMAAQDGKTGKIEGASGDNITAYASAVLTKYSYLSRETDPVYSGECYKAGGKAWNYIQKADDVDAAYRFYAAAELYRLTGNNAYHKIAVEYLEERGELKAQNVDVAFFGEVTYLVTQKSVNIELCDRIMNRIMDEAEVISENTRSRLFLVCMEEGAENIPGMLEKLVKMAVVDYVISNHEYATVLENHLHYLLGRNRDAVSYIEGYGKVSADKDEIDILSNPRNNSAFIFMMSAIEKHEEDVE